MYVVVAFDLEEVSDYAPAYKILEKLGLFPVTPGKGLDLPSTTVMGKLSVDVPAAELRDYIWERLESKGLRPTAILGGVLTDWAARSK